MSHVTRHSHASQCLLYINSIHRLYNITALDQLPLSSQLVPSTQQVSRSSSSSTYIGIASTALIRGICGGVQTGVLTDGVRPGVDWPERLESEFLGRTGEGVNGGTGKLPARVQKVKLLNTQSINGL